MAGYVTGAAVIGGELVLSLSDGQIINCGLIQGAPGPKGEPGPIGPSGKDGERGNGMLHGVGVPRPDIGEQNDFYYRTDDPTIYGPKTGSGWGSGVRLKPKEFRSTKSAISPHKSGTSGANSLAFGSGGGSSSVITPPPTGGTGTGSGLLTIIGHNQPATATTTARTLWEEVDGDLIKVIVFFELNGVGAYTAEIIVYKGPNSRCGLEVGWESSIGGPLPTVDFDGAVIGTTLRVTYTTTGDWTRVRGKVIKF